MTETPESNKETLVQKRSPMGRNEKILTTIIILVVSIALFIRFVPISFFGVNVVALSPGSAPTTIEKINVQGTDTYLPEGTIKFTTVAIESDSLTIWEYFQAKNDEIKELRNREDFYGDKTKTETKKINNFMMQQSQDTASLVAANYLGYEIVPKIDGAYVIEIMSESPASEFLQLGDLIVQVDGLNIESPKDLGEAIQSKKPKDTVAIGFKRSDSAFTTPTSDQEILIEEITLATNPLKEDTGYLGVVIQTPLKADIPFEITIDVGRVGGPSAGLAFALSIVDYLTEGELTGGLNVATTGTIDQYGNVGSVGAYPQKAEAAARSGVELFLVPPGGYQTVLRVAANRFEVRCVSTFDDAIIQLEKFGGNGIQVATQLNVPEPVLSPATIDENDGYFSCAEAMMETVNN
ncbi:MAG: PDZ domain-containing protein [Acidimicrobiales bacterium]|jgi:PDZ domain-containing protein|nr:PDZ domain-containing protein [Acidimicrobiales bacterium]MDP6298203.1 PDZ domain-containing protein [Acidimicrobiales bacterium]HJM28930.1 PDZ domain-containing protein [Acidimicrobiales bacterium]HJM97779.1 PDZ domain-containing protein [Acidimicrobiales bacterium]